MTDNNNELIAEIDKLFETCVKNLTPAHLGVLNAEIVRLVQVDQQKIRKEECQRVMGLVQFQVEQAMNKKITHGENAAYLEGRRRAFEYVLRDIAPYLDTSKFSQSGKFLTSLRERQDER